MSDMPNETIKPAYPLGDANAKVPVSQGGIGKGERKGEARPKEGEPEHGSINNAPTQPAPAKVDEPQTDGE